MNLIRCFKTQTKLFVRFLSDVFFRRYHRFAKKQTRNIDLPYSQNTTQEIKHTVAFENKLYNIKKAANDINQYIVMPGELFSFWKIVGNPNGDYKKGRSIIKGKIKEEIGGGLCQVSGILYCISILCGIEVLERHNHSVDIYTDETRFTSLGTDAAVVYGYKDLRLRNNYSFPIKFCLSVSGDKLEVCLLSASEIVKKNLFFEVIEDGSSKFVIVKDTMNIILNKSKYIRNNE